MTDPRNVNLALYAAKLETAEGTDATPSGADAIALLANFDPTSDYAFKTPRDAVVKGADLGAEKPLPPSGRIVQWGKSAHFRGTVGAPSALNPIELDAWFQSAGLGVTYNGTSARYAPANTGLKTITEYVWHDGKLRKAVGVRGELALSFDVGAPCVIQHTGTGVLEGEVDAAVPAGTFKSTTPPVATDMSTFDVDGFAAGIARKFSCKTGNDIQRRTGVKAPGGVVGHRLNKRKATWEVVLEEPTIATKDFEALVASGADVAIHWVLGALANNTLAFDALEAVIEACVPSNDNGTPIITLSGGLYGTEPFALTIE